MSALPPNADIDQRHWNVRFVPKADIETNLVCQLFDHLVGDLLEMHRHVEAQRLGGLEVDD